MNLQTIPQVMAITAAAILEKAAVLLFPDNKHTYLKNGLSVYFADKRETRMLEYKKVKIYLYSKSVQFPYELSSLELLQIATELDALNETFELEPEVKEIKEQNALNAKVRIAELEKEIERYKKEADAWVG